MGAIINNLPAGGSGIKGSTLFPWMIDGELDTSEAFGGMGVNTEANGRSNLSTMAEDGYLRLYNTSGGNGRVVISTANHVVQGDYDYVLFHIVSLTTTTSNQPLTFGGKTSKDTYSPGNGSPYSLGNVSMSDAWLAVPIVRIDSNNYFAFGGTIDCTIDKIYFVKVKN